MRLDQRVFMVLRLTENGGQFAGSWMHPQKMNTDGYTFSGLGGGMATDPIVSAAMKNGSVQIVVANANDHTHTTEFDVTLITPNDAAVTLVGSAFEPWHFRRSAGAETSSVASDWDSARSYPLELPSATPNPDMRAIFAEDQAARQSLSMVGSGGRALIEQDAARRERTRALLTRGELRAGEDFRNAAFVLQHGTAPDDFLLAHTLALIALARGDRSAAWIAAATFDRYLHSIGRPQIYGTQFSPGSAADQAPYDQALISDALRRELHVPPLADQRANIQSLLKNDGSKATEKK